MVAASLLAEVLGVDLAAVVAFDPLERLVRGVEAGGFAGWVLLVAVFAVDFEEVGLTVIGLSTGTLLGECFAPDVVVFLAAD